MANLAINGGTPVRTKSFPSWPTFDEKDLKVFEEATAAGGGISVVQKSLILQSVLLNFKAQITVSASTVGRWLCLSDLKPRGWDLTMK